jgi:hypothetical protein
MGSSELLTCILAVRAGTEEQPRVLSGHTTTCQHEKKHGVHGVVTLFSDPEGPS